MILCFFLPTQENFPKEKCEKRCVTESESPLTEVQEIGKPQLTSTPKTVVKEGSPDGLYQKYQEVIKIDNLWI